MGNAQDYMELNKNGVVIYAPWLYAGGVASNNTIYAKNQMISDAVFFYTDLTVGTGRSVTLNIPSHARILHVRI